MLELISPELVAKAHFGVGRELGGQRSRKGTWRMRKDGKKMVKLNFEDLMRKLIR